MLLERLTYLLTLIDPTFFDSNDNNNDNNNNDDKNNIDNNDNNDKSINDIGVLQKNKKQKVKNFTKLTATEGLRKEQIDEKWKKELNAWSNL